MSTCCASAPAPLPELLQIMQCSLCGEECRSWWEGSYIPPFPFFIFCLPYKAHKQSHTWRITGEGKWGRRPLGRSRVFGKCGEDISTPLTPSLRLKLTGRIWFDGEGRIAQLHPNLIYPWPSSKIKQHHARVWGC